MLVRICLVEENGRISNDILRLKHKRSHVPETGPPLESRTRSVRIEVQSCQSGKFVQVCFDYGHRRVAIDGIRDGNVIALGEVHVRGGLLLPWLTSSQQVLSAFGSQQDTKPAARFTNRADWHGALICTETVVDDRYDGRLASLRSPRNDVHESKLEVQHPRFPSCIPRPENDGFDLQLHQNRTFRMNAISCSVSAPIHTPSRSLAFSKARTFGRDDLGLVFERGSRAADVVRMVTKLAATAS